MDENHAVVPTDKTNSDVVLRTKDYIEHVVKHLKEDAVLTTRDKLKEAKERAKLKLKNFRNLFSESEYNYIKSTINKCSVPTVHLLIKDHKDKDKINHHYPSRLVTPAKNFTSAFPHVGQRGLKQILDRNKIPYSKKNIIQASDLKDQLELMAIRKSQHRITSIDAEKMYPSIKFIQIQKAVNYFLRDASEEDKEIARRCLEMIKFGMDNTFVTFKDRYWIYGGNLPVEEKGLTIGGYESAFLADLVAAWILEETFRTFLSTPHSTKFIATTASIF